MLIAGLHIIIIYLVVYKEAYNLCVVCLCTYW